MTAAARALLESVIDYAGLFPPAGLSMRDAVDRFAAARLGPHGWMLGRFVVPAARMNELEAVVAARDEPSGVAWPLTVLLDERFGTGEPPPGLLAGPLSPSLRIDGVDLRVETAADVERTATALPRGPEWWFEVAVGPALGSTLDAIRGVGGSAKIRTGGVTQRAFPSAVDVGRFMLACAKAGVRFKATAGLHHVLCGSFRVTYADDSPRASMHGFLNVLLAGALAGRVCRERYPDAEAHAEIVALLEEDDVRAFGWNEAGIRWRTHAFDSHALAASRRVGARSFGSCSFDEPVRELADLGIIPASSSTCTSTTPTTPTPSAG